MKTDIKKLNNIKKTLKHAISITIAFSNATAKGEIFLGFDFFFFSLFFFLMFTVNGKSSAGRDPSFVRMTLIHPGAAEKFLAIVVSPPLEGWLKAGVVKALLKNYPVRSGVTPLHRRGILLLYANSCKE